MFRWFRLMWYKITGQMDRYSDTLATDRNVIAQTFDRNIKAAAADTNEMVDVISEVADLRDNVGEQLKAKTKELTHWTNVRDGSFAAAKKRSAGIIADMKSKGVNEADRIKQAIDNDPEYIRANGAYNDAMSSLKQLTDAVTTLEGHLKEHEKKLHVYGSKLKEMQKSRQALQTEKIDTIAATTIARREAAAQQRLAGLGDRALDRDLELVRNARRKVEAKAKVLTDLTMQETHAIDKEYAQYAEKLQTNRELETALDIDKMISGDTTEALAPAKLPE